MKSYREKLDIVKESYNKRIGARDRIVKENETLVAKKFKCEDLMIQLANITQLLINVSSHAREEAKTQLESIVTTALQYVSEDSYEFKIEPVNGKKPGYEFFVVSKINGIVSKQKPQDACGGGFVDIIATALRYVYLNSFANPVINNAIILDEPGKMISEGASIKFAEFIKHLGNSFNRQTIMVTHNESLVNVADKTHLIQKINGQSIVCKPNTSPISVLTGVNNQIQDWEALTL